MRGYLERLHAAGWSLSPDRRAELVDEVREHIAAALTVERDRGVREEVATRTALDRLGPPEDIVRAEVESTSGAAPPYAPPSPPSSPWGVLEVGAVVVLVLVPVLGTLLGLLLAWASPRWTDRQKKVATGLAILPSLLFFTFVRLTS